MGSSGSGEVSAGNGRNPVPSGSFRSSGRGGATSNSSESEAATFGSSRTPAGEDARLYRCYVKRKISVLIIGIILLVLAFLVSLSVGAVAIPLKEVVRVFFGGNESRWGTIILNIRLPQSLAAIVAGTALAISGAVMQAILHNPLGSPLTLGISKAAAFGAAFSVMILGTGVMQSTAADAVSVTNPYLTSMVAFGFALIATAIILVISGMTGASSEVMVLAGVAIGFLCTAGTMFLQYFADDVQLAAMVFWTFGDVARIGWRELAICSVVTVVGGIYFLIGRFNLNVLAAGDETALGLGVPVKRVRLTGMVTASCVTAVTISFVGEIGFIGLIAPHLVRKILGEDYRYLLPGSIIAGALLLLVADTAARLILAPTVLPVSILTSFVGAPLFIFLLIRGGRR